MAQKNIYLYIYILESIAVCSECGDIVDTLKTEIDASLHQSWTDCAIRSYNMTSEELTSFLYFKEIKIKQKGENPWEHGGAYITCSTEVDSQWVEFTIFAPEDSDLYNSAVLAEEGVDAYVTLYKGVKYEENGLCESCWNKLYGRENEMVYLDTPEVAPEDNLFKIMRWSHGISAFNTAENVAEVFRRIKFVATQKAQICVSHKTQPIGPIGVYIVGTPLCVSTVDLWSEIDEHGRRYTRDTDRALSIVKTIQEYSLDNWDHTETILVPEKIEGIWVKEWYMNSLDLSQRSLLKRIADFFGVKLYVIKSRKR